MRVRIDVADQAQRVLVIVTEMDDGSEVTDNIVGHPIDLEDEEAVAAYDGEMPIDLNDKTAVQDFAVEFACTRYGRPSQPTAADGAATETRTWISA